MKTPSIFVLPACCLWAAACTLSAQQPATLQHLPTPPLVPHRPAPFELQLSADPQRTSASGVIHLHLRLASHTRTPWLVVSPIQEGPGASYALHIYDHATGKEVVPPFLADARLPPGPVHCTKLAPGGHLDTTTADTAKNFGLTPGHTYDITATYHSPLPPNQKKGPPILSQSQGEFTSNTVQLSIAP